MMYYYSTPNYSVALNAKVASSSMARAIIRQFHASANRLITTAAYPAGMDETKRAWHWLCAGSSVPDKPVVLLVRDPVDRFVTACQQVGIQQGDVDAAIASLVLDVPFARSKPADMTEKEWADNREKRKSARQRAKEMRQRRIDTGRPVRKERDPDRLRQNVHFFRQSDYIVGQTTCFQFPRDIAAAAAFIGIAAPMPEANKAKRQKPKLTPQQENAVREYYAADVALFASITTPATVVTK